MEWFVTNLQRVEIVGKRKNDDGRKNDTQIDFAIGLIYRGRAKQEDLNKQLRFASTGNDLDLARFLKLVGLKLSDQYCNDFNFYINSHYS